MGRWEDRSCNNRPAGPMPGRGLTMHGLMQSHPVLISSLIEHAAHPPPHAEIVSRTSQGGIARHSYADIAARAKQLARALRALGVAEGARVGTMAWNGH